MGFKITLNPDELLFKEVLMRKVILGILVVVMVLGAFQQVQAQEKKAHLGLNLGVMFLGGAIGEDFKLWTFGLSVDYQLAENLVISPEVDLWTFQFHFEAFILSPGVILNYQEGIFFAGAGVILPVVISEFGAADVGLFPKVNIGLKAKNVRLTAYALSNWALSGIVIGASVGFRF